MRLSTILLVVLGAVQATAYSTPGGYERVMIYYAYVVDATLNNGVPKIVATGCKKNGICNLDELLRYISGKSVELPTTHPASPPYPQLPPMDQTAESLASSDAQGRNFAGPIQPGRALPGLKSNDYSEFLAKFGGEVTRLASRAPDFKDILRQNLEAIYNTRQAATYESFLKANPDVKPGGQMIPMYKGAPQGRDVEIRDARALILANGKDKAAELVKKWDANSEGGHLQNVRQLKEVIGLFDLTCG